MFNFLRAIGLHPVEWLQWLGSTGTATPLVPDVLYKGLSSSQAVVVVLNGEDMAYLREEFRSDSDPAFEGEPTPQPRPNVLFEAGLALATYPDETILVQIGQMRPFSDIAGRLVIRMTNDPADRHNLAERLRECGCDVNTTGGHWLNTGDFAVVEPTSTVNLRSMAIVPSNMRLRFIWEPNDMLGIRCFVISSDPSEEIDGTYQIELHNTTDRIINNISVEWTFRATDFLEMLRDSGLFAQFAVPGGIHSGVLRLQHSHRRADQVYESRTMNIDMSVSSLGSQIYVLPVGGSAIAKMPQNILNALGAYALSLGFKANNMPAYATGIEPEILQTIQASTEPIAAIQRTEEGIRLMRYHELPTVEVKARTTNHLEECILQLIMSVEFHRGITGKTKPDGGVYERNSPNFVAVTVAFFPAGKA